ncbi:hypothetical protein Trydic_g119 [Trypoxylus dichotomus]
MKSIGIKNTFTLNFSSICQNNLVDDQHCEGGELKKNLLFSPSLKRSEKRNNFDKRLLRHTNNDELTEHKETLISTADSFLTAKALTVPVEVKALVGSEIGLPCHVDTDSCGGLHSVKFYKETSRIFVYSQVGGISRGEEDAMTRLVEEHFPNTSDRFQYRQILPYHFHVFTRNTRLHNNGPRGLPVADGPSNERASDSGKGSDRLDEIKFRQCGTRITPSKVLQNDHDDVGDQQNVENTESYYNTTL